MDKQDKASERVRDVAREAYKTGWTREQKNKYLVDNGDDDFDAKIQALHEEVDGAKSRRDLTIAAEDEKEARRKINFVEESKLRERLARAESIAVRVKDGEDNTDEADTKAREALDAAQAALKSLEDMKKAQEVVYAKEKDVAEEEIAVAKLRAKVLSGVNGDGTPIDNADVLREELTAAEGKLEQRGCFENRTGSRRLRGERHTKLAREESRRRRQQFTKLLKEKKASAKRYLDKQRSIQAWKS